MKTSSLVSLALFTLVGCAPTDAEIDRKFQSIVKERASVELDCPAHRLALRALPGFAYLAEGCGGSQVYECDLSTGFDSDKTLYVCKAADSPPRAATPSPCGPDAGD